MIYPEFLKEKDTIGVTAPSDGITDEVKLKRLDNAIKSFEETELKWKLDYIFTSKDIKIKETKVVDTKYSDHLPILIVIKL